MALFWLSGVFILGVVLGGAADPRVAFALSGVALLSALATRRTRFGWYLLLVSVLFVGCARAPHGGGAGSTGDLNYYNGRYLTVLGQVAAEPDVRDTGANYVVSARTVTLTNRAPVSVSGRLELHTSLGQRFEYGDDVQLTGLLQTPLNTPALPYRDILLGKGIASLMSFPRAIDTGPASSGFLGWIVPFRQQLEAGINRSLPEPEAALLIAITLGAHSASLGTLVPVLVSTGLIHLIAISGIKVAMVAGTVWALFSALRRRILTLTASLVVILFYVLLTGATASGERSALMWALVFTASYLGRGTVALVSLAFAAATMVAFDPMLPWDVGFQLSTVGTFAIVTMSGPFLRLFRFVPSPFREALGVTLAAQLGTVPIVAGGFHSISLIGPVANALVLPLLPLTILLGFLLGLCSNLSIVATPLAVMAYAVTHAIVMLSRALAGFSSAALPVSSPTPALAIGYYTVLAGLAWFLLRRAGWAPLGHWGSRVREVTFALLLVASAATVSQAEGTTPARLSVLGSGTSLLLQSEGRTALIDGSPRPLALLTALGDQLGMRVRSIDLVVVTDPSSSNVTALLSLLDHYRVKTVLDVGAQYPGRTYAAWRSALRARRVPVYTLRTGVTTQVGAVSLQAIAPDALCYAPANCAGIIRLAEDHGSFLVATHAGAREQDDVIFRRLPLRADTLFLGDAGHASPDFVRVVRPRSLWCTLQAPALFGCHSLQPGRILSWPV
ncbi:MAG TPA: ComEC/Rec2 family competence protein [Chloroflexota bacterium]